MMFGLNKKEKSLNSPVSGKIISIDKVPDEVFSQKILGDGFAVIPSDGNILSPANGTVAQISETLHAYCINSPDGLEILVHIGIDTVKLKGNGFSPLVNEGDKISKGAPIACVDLETIKNHGLNTAVVTVITNTEKLKSHQVLEAPDAPAGTSAFIYKI